MKRVNVNTRRKYYVAIISAVMAMGMLAGCGKKGAVVDGPEPDMNEVMEKVEEGYSEEPEATEAEAKEAEALEDGEEEGNVVTPFLADLEKYDSIISTLTTEQYYAFAGVGENEDVLLVTDGVYDYGEGLMAAIDATVYGFGEDGNIYQAGSVWSDGTAYPIAVYDDKYLMFGGNHHMTMAFVRDGSVVIEREADETFDEEGNATYSFNDGDIDNIQEVDDNSVLTEMYDKYAKALPVNFFQGTAEATGDMEVGDYPSNELESRTGKTSFASYDEIIGLLEGDEAYALVDVKGYDGKVLLVAENVYDDLLGHMATIECTPYTVKSNGTCTADSLLTSGGTATPLAIDGEGVIYSATHMSVEKSCYGENGTDNVAVMMLASVYADELDDEGNPKSVGGFVREKNSVVDDDSVFLEGNEVELYKQLFDEYNKAEPINFTKVTK